MFWIVDNGSSHRGAAAIDRLANQYPNASVVHLPVHASWLDQVEIYFSIVQRKVLSPNDFTQPDPIGERLPAFEPLQHESQAIQMEIHPHRPCELLKRLDAHRKILLHPGSMTPDELTDETTKGQPSRPLAPASAAPARSRPWSASAAG